MRCGKAVLLCAKALLSMRVGACNVSYSWTRPGHPDWRLLRRGLLTLQVSNYCSGDVCVDDRAWPSTVPVSASVMLASPSALLAT